MASGDRILTDASGPFFTVVTETEVESLAEWEHRTAEIFAVPEFGDWFARMVPLVESGRRELYNIEKYGTIPCSVFSTPATTAPMTRPGQPKDFADLTVAADQVGSA